MKRRLGDRLIENKLITEEQLHAALERQRIHGGRIGYNLLALNLISKEGLSKFFKMSPPIPKTVEETGLEFSFIADLIMKHVLFMGEFTISEVSDRVKLSFPVVEKAIDMLRNERFLEVKSAAQLTKATYQFAITEQGRNRANGLLDICRYIGPAPVTLEQYRSMVEMQTVKNLITNEESIKNAFSHLVVSDQILGRVGPAVCSGRAIFLYGPAGNGKTTIAETIGKVLPETVYMPHALLAGGEIITIYDLANHILAEPDPGADETDPRWVLTRRPVVMAGGELTLKTLDLEFNPISKFYEAPLQMKANNGLFIVDDFGRQQMDPKRLMNRWIVPLERRTDLLTLQTGMKFEIPFDQLVIFATNLEPKNLVDEAFLRRIRYKIKIDHPTVDEYEAIFRKICDSNGITFKKEIFNDLIDNYYRRTDIKLNACHPRDIIDHIIDDAYYYDRPPELTREVIAKAWKNYFVEM